MTLPNHIGRTIGFTSNLFDGYLRHDSQRIIISLISSQQPGQGNLSRLFAAIEAQGFEIAVPTPSIQMRAILMHKGFVPTI